MKRVLIVCIGNSLVADDAVGYHLYTLLGEEVLGPDVRRCMLGTGGMAIIDELAGEQCLIVVDAVQLGANPGTIHVLGWEELPRNEMRPVSGHGIGVREALQVCHRLFPEKVPARTYLVGIEGACFDLVGAGLSPHVEKALPHAVEHILDLSR